LALAQIAPGLSQIGILLPYSPLLELIAQRWRKPLIATSGNISGSPIFYRDEHAIKNLRSVADLFVINNRDIVVPQDDSVIRFAGEQRVVLRRSRGLAPTYLPNPFAESDQTILAAGSDLKSSFALLTKGNLYVSQYLGDLENFETQQSYYHVLHHLQNLFNTKPTQVLIDAHPIYFSSKFGKALAADCDAEVIEVQHHLAHFSAVLAENNLMKSDEPILGVVWDGTGWGEDGNIWGGEFFIYHENAFERIDHLNYFDHVLGDKLSREPRLSALSICKDIPEAEELLRPKFNSTEWKMYRNLLKQPGNFKTSSVGRLFDGVASLLGLCDKSTYEGEAALLLETCAAKITDKIIEREFQNAFTLQGYLKSLISRIKEGVPKEILAYQFHLALVHWIEEVALRQQVKHLAFSGGVFQNALLNRLINQKLGLHYNLFFHHQLSCNDECIGFGQLAYEQIQKQKLQPVEQIQLTTEMI
jgi:hydrogenase maturation protein HypF